MMALSGCRSSRVAGVWSRRPTAAARRGWARSEHFPVCSHAVSRGVTAQRDASSIRTPLTTGPTNGCSGKAHGDDHVATIGSQASQRCPTALASRSTSCTPLYTRRDQLGARVRGTLAARAGQGRRGRGPLALPVQRLGSAQVRGGLAWGDSQVSENSTAVRGSLERLRGPSRGTKPSASSQGGGPCVSEKTCPVERATGRVARGSVRTRRASCT